MRLILLNAAGNGQELSSQCSIFTWGEKQIFSTYRAASFLGSARTLVILKMKFERCRLNSNQLEAMFGVLQAIILYICYFTILY